MKCLVQAAVAHIKKRPFFIDPCISGTDLAYIALRNGLALVRGILRCRRLVALGRGVRLVSKARLNLQRGVNVGDYVVLDALGRRGISIGTGSSIGSFSILKVSGTLSDLGLGIDIGRNVGIGEFAHIGGAGGVRIGDDTIVGAYFSVHPESHNFADKQSLIREQGVTRKGVNVGMNCWIGAKVTLLDGCHIGDNTVVAAGAVVRGEFPGDVVIGGVPAVIIKARC